MHSRNIYKNPINFVKLAEENPEILKFMNVSLSGRAKYNFKDPNAISFLTKTLLKRDFKLDVDVPPEKLVPTLGLRLNYLLWIEDLVKQCNTTKGIDIGTGASAIFALLAAKNGWQMLATETSSSSCEIATENIKRNNLGHLIKLRHVENSAHVLKEVLDEGVTYHFSMCNPPFFDIAEEPAKRTPYRNEPNNAPTGSSAELSTKGGELRFVSQMIEDSKDLQVRVQIYTTMLGKRGSLRHCREKLSQANVKSHVTNVFQQGRTTRWGLAWSYCLDLPATGFHGKKNLTSKSKEATDLAFTLPNCSEESASEKLRKVFDDLEFSYEKKELSNCWRVKASEKTWVGTRRRRREKLRNEKGKESNGEPPGKRAKLEQDTGPSSKESDDTPNDSQIAHKETILEFEAKISRVEEKASVFLRYLSGSAGETSIAEIKVHLMNKMSKNVTK